MKKKRGSHGKLLSLKACEKRSNCLVKGTEKGVLTATGGKVMRNKKVCLGMFNEIEAQRDLRGR